MTSLLRQIVAGPRARHAESKLDLCYLTDEIIVTSGPAISYPSVAYRNPLPRLVSFLTKQHNEDWRIFEFRAEGTGYSDKDVGGRVRHFPWPDHHPPPFIIMPELIESMRSWLEEGSDEGVAQNGNDGAVKDGKKAVKRVAILHCKAGKGRSGTVACSFLISSRGWKVEDALKRFTERRMRPGWGEGISIKSQRRWIDYVERWARQGKIYHEGRLKIIEIQLWGRRENVTVMIRGFVKAGKKIKVLHKWKDTEGETTEISAKEMAIETGVGAQSGQPDSNAAVAKPSESTRIDTNPSHNDSELPADTITTIPSGKLPSVVSTTSRADSDAPLTYTVLRPAEPLIMSTLDANIEVERRNTTAFSIPSVVTSTAHSWFNAYFEGQGPEKGGHPDRTGAYTIDWDAMDGLKGSSRRGVRAIEKVSVLWEIMDQDEVQKDEKPVERKFADAQDTDSEPTSESRNDSRSHIVEGGAGDESEAEEALQSFVPDNGKKGQ